MKDNNPTFTSDFDNKKQQHLVIKKSKNAMRILHSLTLYSTLQIAVIFIVLLILFLLTTENALSIPNTYYPGLSIVDHPPVVKAGPDQIVKENETVVFHGIANDSDPGDKIS